METDPWDNDIRQSGATQPVERGVESFLVWMAALVFFFLVVAGLQTVSKRTMRGGEQTEVTTDAPEEKDPLGFSATAAPEADLGLRPRE